MFRSLIIFFAFVLFAAGGMTSVPAQQPPPEGAPQAGNPYAQPYSPNATAAPAPNPAMTKRAKSWFAQLQSGKIDRSQLTAGATGNMTDATIANARTEIGDLGAPVSFVLQRSGSQAGISYGIYKVTFKDGKTVDFLFAVDGQGKVTSLGLGSPR
jgi:hypothetical protein